MVIGIGERVFSLPVITQYNAVQSFADAKPSCSVILLTSEMSSSEVQLLEDTLLEMPKLNFLFMRCDDKVDVAARSPELLPMVKRLYKLGRITKWVTDSDGALYRRYVRNRADLNKLIGVETVAKSKSGSLANQTTSLGGVIKNVRKATPAENQRYLIQQGKLYEVGYACNGHKKQEIVVEIRY